MVVVFWLLIGLASAAVFLVVTRLAPEREMKTLKLGLVVATIIYVGFAVVGSASPSWIAMEIAGIGIYSLLAVLGLCYSKWWLMLGWLLHPVWDIELHLIGRGAHFTPSWYALGCVGFDLLVAAYICGVQVRLINNAANHFERGQTPMNSEVKRQFLLKSLLIACIISTAIHFTDNYLYIEQYPQPNWIKPSSVYISWVIWTVIGLSGYWLYRSERFWLAYLCLAVYSFCGLDSLGHYLYGAMSEFSMKMHFLIVMDGLTGLAMLGFTLWSGLILKEQFRESRST